MFIHANRNKRFLSSLIQMIPVSVMSDKMRSGVSLTMYIILSHAKEPCTRTAQSLRVWLQSTSYT